MIQQTYHVVFCIGLHNILNKHCHIYSIIHCTDIIDLCCDAARMKTIYWKWICYKYDRNWVSPVWYNTVKNSNMPQLIFHAHIYCLYRGVQFVVQMISCPTQSFCCMMPPYIIESIALMATIYVTILVEFEQEKSEELMTQWARCELDSLASPLASHLHVNRQGGRRVRLRADWDNWYTLLHNIHSELRDCQKAAGKFGRKPRFEWGIWMSERRLLELGSWGNQRVNCWNPE